MRTIAQRCAGIIAMTLAQEIGQTAENQACAYLQQQGLRLVTRNYRCKVGEIDLIMRDKTDLVFVEVRYRKNDSFGGGLQSITSAKQAKLTRAASFYLQRNRLTENIPCRFDVIAIGIQQGKSAIEWIKNAF
jgi:putative endonuclease